MKKLAVLGIFVFLVFSGYLVKAQSQWEIRLNLVSKLEAEDQMLLKLYFNVYDPATGTPLTVLNAEDAQVTLINTGYASPAMIQEPDLPIYITLVLDSSGSMGGSAQKLRDAAKLALNNIPDNALFGVVQFDEQISLLQDFTDNIPAITYAIDQYTVSTRGTCLYDAAYAAVETQANAPQGRRAVILFTDGKDEKRGASVCSTHTFQELLDLALEMQVPVHTIGLTGLNSNINELELKNLAAITGGFSFFATQDNLPEAFSQIMQSLKAQWMVQADVYPLKGVNEAVFSLMLEDGETINTAFSFESETDYPGPPSPVQARFDGLQLVAETQSYDVQMTLTSPELVGYVKISLWDADAGAKVAEYVFEDPATFNTFNIPTSDMVADRKYELRIIAVSNEDNTAFAISEDNQGNTQPELVHEFRFDPSSIFASAEIVSVTQAGSDLELNVSLTNPGMIGGFDGWLVDKTTNTQVSGSGFSLPADAADSGSIVIPMRENRIPSGKYLVVLRVLNAQGRVLTTTQYDDVTYKAPGLIQRLSIALIAAPMFLAVVVGIVLAVVAFLMVSSSRQKAMTGTPVMQGELGNSKRSRKKAAGGLMAIADDEPVLQQKAQVAPPAPEKKAKPAPASKPADSTQVDFPEEAETVVLGKSQSGQPFLTGVKGPRSGTWLISTIPFVIGREACDLVVAEPSVSRRHAEITRDNNYRYFITDLNSSNGTKLNGKPITAGQQVPLQPGTRIDLGSNVSFQFEVK
ncbi:VWA domain-containing protein [bacterium]|nr:VWA domain-containing protein [bacterium]